MTQTLDRQTWKTGVYRNVPFLDYLRIDAINWHTLEPYRISAREARYQMLQPLDATDALRIGEATHAAILEPDRFAADYAAMPAFDGHPNSKAHRDAKAAWQENNREKVSLLRDEYDEIMAMATAAREHPVASRLLDGRGRNELTIIWREKKTGVLCKGRLDRICYAPAAILFPTSNFSAGDQILCLVDIKTTRKPIPGDFDLEVARYAYHGQQAWYLDGVNATEPAPMLSVIVAVQNSAPWDVIVYRVDDEVIEQGRRLHRRLLRRHLQCSEEKRWPGAAESIMSIALPAWAQEKESNLEA